MGKDKTAKEYLEEFTSIPTETRLNWIKEDLSNVQDIFINYLWHYLFAEFHHKSNYNNGLDTLVIADTFFKRPFDFISSYKEYSKILDIIEEGAKIVEPFISDEELGSRAMAFSIYAKAYHTRTRHAYMLYQEVKHEDFNIELFITQRIMAGAIDLVKLSEHINKIFSIVDNLVLSNLMSGAFLTDEKEIKEDLNRYFDFDFYSNPSILAYLEEERLHYLKVLKTVLLEKLIPRKVGLRVAKFQVPLEYKIIEDYAMSLLKASGPSPGIHRSQSTSKYQLKYDFNPDLFACQKSQGFFELWVSQNPQHASISFIFRMMSEQENPPLIKRRDMDFRSWYNNLPNVVPLISFTRTFLQTKNSRRLKAYYSMKALFFETEHSLGE